MSNVSDILDRFSTVVESQVSGIKQIPNPYDPESAPQTYLQNAYGLGYGPGFNASDAIDNCDLFITREIAVMQLKEVAKVSTDQAGIEAQLKTMLENELLIIKAITNDPQLSDDGAGTVALNARFTDTDAPEFLIGERGRYFRTLTLFEVLYKESLS